MPRLCCAALCAALITTAALADDIPHHHLGESEAVDQFYSTWMKPDKPTQSCCNKVDCYSTEVRFERGIIFAKRREDGKWLRVPPEKIEQNRDSPDGRNHMCAPTPGLIRSGNYPEDTVFCFKLGGGG